MKVLPIAYAFIREALAIIPVRSLTAPLVEGILARSFTDRGRLGVLRSDDGSEFIDLELIESLKAKGSSMYYPRLGKPAQNSFGESFGKRLRRMYEHHRVLEHRPRTHDARSMAGRVQHRTPAWLSQTSYRRKNWLLLRAQREVIRSDGEKRATSTYRVTLRKRPNHQHF